MILPLACKLRLPKRRGELHLGPKAYRTGTTSVWLLVTGLTRITRLSALLADAECGEDEAENIFGGGSTGETVESVERDMKIK